MFANRLNVLVTIMLAVTLLVMESGSAQMDDDSQLESKRSIKDTPDKYCQNLPNILWTVCKGIYTTIKKFGNEEIEMVDYQDTNKLSPFLQRLRAYAMYDRANRRYRKYRRGIYEECCLKSCTLSEIKAYCDP